MKKLSQLLESINEVNSLLELDFKSKDSFQKYQAKHKMKPTTKVNIAGKDTTVGDEMGDDSETPQAPKKTTGADIEKQADKSGKEVDDIEKGIMGNEPKLDPKVKQRAQDNYNDAINNIKNPQMAGGIEPYYVDMAADNLEKLGNPDAKVFKDLGKEFRDNLDDDGNPKDEKLDKQIQDKIKLAALDLETDITKDIAGDLMGDEPKKEVDSEDLDAKDFQAAKQAFDKIKDIDMDAFEDGPEGYKQMMDALELLKGTQLDNYKTLQRDIDALKTNQEQDSAELVRYTLSSLKDKKDPFSGKYLGEVKNENFDLRQLSKITTRYNK